MKRILLFPALLGWMAALVADASAQCTVTAAATSTTIPCGSCTTLSASGTSGGTYAFIETFNNGNPTGWAFTQSVTIGTNTCGVPSPDGTPFMWMGNSSVNPRDMTTVAFNLTSGGTICFEMRYAIQAQGSPCEGPDLPNEGVHLQYSTNGTTWTDIQYWPPTNGGSSASPLTSWHQYCLNIPPGAQTASTQIRWHQDAVSGADYDHWGIDNVEISVFGPPYTITWTHDNFSLPAGTMSGSNPAQVCPDSVQTYEVVMTNGEHTCTSTVTVNIDYPHIDNIVLNDPNCGNADGSIQVMASGGIGGYQYSIDDSTTFQPANLFSSLDGDTYYVVVVDQNDCWARDTVQLFAVNAMAIIDDSVIHTSCGQQDGEISFIATGGTPDYQFSIDNGATYHPDSLFVQLSSGNYNIIAKDINGCTAAGLLTVNASTSPVIDSLRLDPEMCGLQNGRIIAYPSLGIQPYAYVLNTAQPQGGNMFENLQGGSYTLVITDAAGCTVDSVFALGATPAPVIVFGDTSLCGLTLSVTGINSATGSQWSSAFPEISFSNVNAQTPVLTASQSGVYVINFKDTVCHVDEDFTVTFIPQPLTMVRDTMICIGEQYNLVAKHFPQNTSYTWNTGATGTVQPVNETGFYIVTAHNVCGIDLDTAFIELIACDLEIPNVFTPNGDGSNDYFSLIEFAGIESFSCVILNRWGNVMREFTQPSFAWDGKDASGNDATEGTYFYIVKATTKGHREISKHGTVTLVRNK